MGFTRLPSAAFAVGKATSMSLWMLVRKNSNSNESRIVDLEGSPPSIVTGMILPYAGSSAPTGYILCDGSAISRTTYSALFTKLSTTYGVGDGSTTFNIPDFRGRTLMGYGAGSGLTSRLMGATGGNETHTLSTSELPSHNHGVTDPTHRHAWTSKKQYNSGSVTPGPANDVDQFINGGNSDSTWVTASATTGITVDNAGGGGSHPNIQPCLVLNFIIKT